MKILIITASDPYKTSGIVALDLYKSLKYYGNHEVKIIAKGLSNIKNKDIIYFDSVFYHLLYKLNFKLNKLFKYVFVSAKRRNNINPDYIIHHFDQTKEYHSASEILEKYNDKPDFIVILFMEPFYTFKTLYELNKLCNAPILLYMMDMSPMTGACHYAWDCKGYYKNCGKCPALNSSIENDQSRINWLFKKEYINKTNISIIAASEWQYRQLLRCSMFKNKQKHKILLSVDDKTFNKNNVVEAKKIIKLPENKKIIFFGAISPNSKRKGYKQLLEAFILLSKRYKDSDIHFAIAGKINNFLNDSIPFDYTSLGYINQKKMVKVFQSAYVFICPSIEDSGPLMINQSIMTGTPVVAFNMGVAVDLVITGKTGYRAKLGDSEDFAKGINYILKLNEDEYKKMRENCRALGIELLQSKKQAENFTKILLSK